MVDCYTKEHLCFVRRAEFAGTLSVIFVPVVIRTAKFNPTKRESFVRQHFQTVNETFNLLFSRYSKHFLSKWKVSWKETIDRQVYSNLPLAPKRTTTTITLSEASATLAESTGGLAFEVKLAESPRHIGNILPPAHFLSPSAKGNQNDLLTPLTPESIIEKLKRAEERRLSLEQLRSTLLAAENNRPVEVSKIKDQQTEGMPSLLR